MLANRLTTAANAIPTGTAPLYVLLLGPWLLHERVRRSDLFYIAAVGLGLTLFFVGRDPAVASAPDPRRGNILALASGVTYALMLAGLRWQGKHGEPDAGLKTAAAGNVLAFFLALPAALPVRCFLRRRCGGNSLFRTVSGRSGVLVPDAGHSSRSGLRGHHDAATGARYEPFLDLAGTPGNSQFVGDGRRRAHHLGDAGEHLA